MTADPSGDRVASVMGAATLSGGEALEARCEQAGCCVDA
jgi:hypothetical protein